MKKIIALALLLPALAHARFEEFVDYETPTPSEANIFLYVYGPMLVWLSIVWSKGWHYRALPIGLMVLSALAWLIWGSDGMGGVAILSFLFALLTGAWWACDKE